MNSAPFTVAVLQEAFSDDLADNLARIQQRVREAAAAGARVILPPELFAGPYFCKAERGEEFARAHSVERSPAVAAMREVARELGVVVPTSFFEADGPHHYNSLALVDADGAIRGVYRKSHIPDGPGYEEKFYFRPGNTGFRVWETGYGRLGVGICWDQWFPECARAMTLLGAELLLYPTAIGSEPEEPDLDTARLWRRAMIGHAVANVIPIAAANRIGTEDGQTFYGSSFICDEWGDLLADADRMTPGIHLAPIDPAATARHRATMGFFRDRRPELYGRLVEP